MPKIFKVGGCIRDAIIGINSKDIDFTFVLDDLSKSVDEGFDEMEKWMSDRGFQIFLSTRDCFTIRAKFPVGDKNEKLVADFVMARKEIGYIPDTRRPILELGTLDDDLLRRDFKCNALAEDSDGKIIDLFNGIKDIQEKILDTPLDPNITFLDDPLRILRAWRFSITKEFLIHPRLIDAMKNPEILQKLERVVSKERIREELLKMFKYDTVSTLELLHQMNKHIPGLYLILYSKGIWLKPTFEI